MVSKIAKFVVVICEQNKPIETIASAVTTANTVHVVMFCHCVKEMQSIGNTGASFNDHFTINSRSCTCEN